MIARLKFYPWVLFNYWYYSVHSESGANPFYPGLEVYKAVENAVANNKKVHFMGGVINESTLAALAHERRMNILSLLYRSVRTKHKYHKTELGDLYDLIMVNDLDQMSEHLDDKHIGMLVYDFEKNNPYQKPIMIDQENQRLFKHIYEKMEGETECNCRRLAGGDREPVAHAGDRVLLETQHGNRRALEVHQSGRRHGPRRTVDRGRDQ